MLIDTRQLESGSLIESDLVVIGGGMAGITIAREFAGSGIDVCILESGGEEPDPAVQDLYRGSARMTGPGNPDKAIDDYLTSSRFRYYGGSGNAWGGKSVPLDPSDFREREWIALSGWPMTREELQPWFDRACDLLGIPRFPADNSAHWSEERPALDLGEAGFESLPRYFTDHTGAIKDNEYGAFKFGVTEEPGVDVHLHANVVDIVLDDAGNQVEALEVATLDGRRLQARGRCYVLATGGIENARLLLASNGGKGIGNTSGFVGRCFQGHVNFGIYEGAAGRNTSLFFSMLDQPLPLYLDGERDQAQAVLAATWEAQQQARLPNFTVTMFKPWYNPQSSSQAVMDMAAIVDGRLVRLDAETPAGKHLQCYFKIEQSPNPESRITLGGERDPLGMPRVRLDWAFDEEDFAGLERGVAFMRRELGRLGLGRVEWPLLRDELIEIMSLARHHMGTTRMATDPGRGIVDADCRVHEVQNLYVAGSSVFPTSGNANPTLTLIALAMRLSHHLATELRS